MNLLRTSFWTGVSTAVRLASGLAVNKAVALYAGPVGMALVGHVQNVSGIAQNFSSGLFGSAAVKFSAEWRGDAPRRRSFLRTAFTVSVLASLGIGLALAASSRLLAGALFGEPGYWWVFALLAALLPTFSINTLVLAELNGIGELRRYTFINVAQSLAGLVLSTLLPWRFGVPGAMAAVVLAPTIVAVLVFPELRRRGWSRLVSLAGAEPREDLRRLRGFALMAMTAALTSPLAQIFVRDWILTRCSPEEAGHWQALQRLSASYLLFFTATLSVYLLPRYAVRAGHALRAEILGAYVAVLPALAVLFLGVWAFRSWLTPLLFSEAFAPVNAYMHVQLAADWVKIGSWILGYVLVARSRTRLFIGTEVGFGLLSCVLVAWRVGPTGAGGARGACEAQLVTYLAYWAFLGRALLPTLRGRA